MSVFTITYILTIITPLYAQDEEFATCQLCGPGSVSMIPVGSPCPSRAPGGESCQTLAGLNVCYWKTDETDVGLYNGVFDVGDRTCENDYHCMSFIDGEEIPVQTDNLANLKMNACLRCCDNLCVETITAGENCGSIDAWLELNNVYPSTNAQVYSHKFNWAPCCPGQVCFDNTLGICGAEADECESCVSWNTQEVDFIDSTQKTDNCAGDLICLTNEAPSATVTFEDFIHLAIEDDITDNTRRRLFHPHNEEMVFVPNLRPRVNIHEGICVAADGVSINQGSCDTDGQCPTCMRCCSDNNGNKQCVRSSGDICGLTFEGKGPCCCPEDVCKSNECITESPTKSPTEIPTETPSESTPAPTGLPTGDSSSDEQEFFGAEQILGGKNDDNDNGTGILNDKIDILIITLWIIIIVLVIGLGALTITSCKKTGQASFNHDTSSTINQNV